MGGKIVRGAIILLAAMAAGFLFGRFGLGEGYLKKSISQIERPPAQPLPAPPEDPGARPMPLIIPDIPAAPKEEEPAKEAAAEDDPAAAAEGTPGQEPQPPAGDETPAAPPEGARAQLAQRYAIQVGSFENVVGARAVARQLRGWGYETEVKPHASPQGITTFRVSAGPYASEAEAQEKANELRERGFPVLVFRSDLRE